MDRGAWQIQFMWSQSQRRLSTHAGLPGHMFAGNLKRCPITVQTRAVQSHDLSRRAWHPPGPKPQSYFFFIRSLVAQMVKHLPAMRETRVRFLGWEDLLEKEMATHSSALAWRIPRTEEPGRLQSMGSQRIGRDWATSLHFLSSTSLVWIAWVTSNSSPFWLHRAIFSNFFFLSRLSARAKARAGNPIHYLKKLYSFLNDSFFS